MSDARQLHRAYFRKCDGVSERQVSADSADSVGCARETELAACATHTPGFQLVGGLPHSETGRMRRGPLVVFADLRRLGFRSDRGESHDGRQEIFVA